MVMGHDNDHDRLDPHSSICLVLHVLQDYQIIIQSSSSSSSSFSQSSISRPIVQFMALAVLFMRQQQKQQKQQTQQKQQKQQLLYFV